MFWVNYNTTSSGENWKDAWYRANFTFWTIFVKSNNVFEWALKKDVTKPNKYIIDILPDGWTDPMALEVIDSFLAQGILNVPPNQVCSTKARQKEMMLFHQTLKETEEAQYKNLTHNQMEDAGRNNIIAQRTRTPIIGSSDGKVIHITIQFVDAIIISCQAQSNIR
jgi:hypothetical protein